mmetsp:Transcript_4688/g.8524  ORF Transcript_4688/g.8524 Transcript_4688/m.8524 type:complete len:84 (-) Transcript_4688:50-301(-)
MGGCQGAWQPLLAEKPENRDRYRPQNRQSSSQNPAKIPSKTPTSTHHASATQPKRLLEHPISFISTNPHSESESESSPEEQHP